MVRSKVEVVGEHGSLSGHLETASCQETALEFSKTLGLARLSIKALELGLHVFVRKRDSCVHNGPNL